jgi:ATP-dependent Clp protease protease subunit
MTQHYDKSPHRHLYENRILYLSGDITTTSADQVVAGLVALDAIDHEAEIKLYLSSFGGSVYAGLAVYDAMMLVRAPVSTLCIGPAFSMAAWLLAAGAPGRRYASRNARIMLHQASAGFSGTTGDIKVAAENILQNQDLLTEILALHTGRDVVDVARMIDRDLWLTPEQALEVGIVDGIIPACGHKMEELALLRRKGVFTIDVDPMRSRRSG